MKYILKPYNLQELGQRENQEDSLFPNIGEQNTNSRLFILCDGMGGHEKGEVASSTVCQAMSNHILANWTPEAALSDETFQQALDAAYDALDAKDNGEAKKMGTTMTFLCFHSEGVTAAHIGDSRIYQIRPATKDTPAHIVFKTRDHSLVNDLIKIGEITEEEAKNHPQKNVITRAMQPGQERRARADIAHLTDIRKGDYFYMCSDGMLEQTTDENLVNIITKKDATDEQKVEMLRSVTEENKDNHTAHIIYVKDIAEAKAEKVVNAQATTEPKGTLVTPEYEKPKSKKALFIVIGAIVLLFIAAGSWYYFTPDSSECKKTLTEWFGKGSKNTHKEKGKPAKKRGKPAKKAKSKKKESAKESVAKKDTNTTKKENTEAKKENV